MGELMPPSTYLLGLDLGQSQDSTALIAASVTENAAADHEYDVGHIERVGLGTRYPEVVKHVCDVVDYLRRPYHVPGMPKGIEKRADVYLIIDYTGVGRPVADMFLDAKPNCNLTLITITGGGAVTADPTGGWRVPKRDLASSVQVVLQDMRVRWAKGLPLVPELKRELTGFRVKINARGHDSYGAGEDWRSAPHDDLVLALAMLVWYGETRLVRGPLAWFVGDDE